MGDDFDAAASAEIPPGVTAEQQVRVLSKNLSLLRQKYAKLTQSLANLQRTVDATNAGGASPTSTSGGIVGDLTRTCAQLAKSGKFSDIKLECAEGRTIPAHRLVLAARSTIFQSMLKEGTEEEALPQSIMLGENVPVEMATDLVQFLYTDAITLSTDADYVKGLMLLSHKFKISRLFTVTESALKGMITRLNCAQLLKAADDVHADDLRKSALEVIVNEFDTLSQESLALLDSNLLAEIYRRKSSYPLHFAIEQNREDVVFLYLLGDDAFALINSRNESGQTPLEVALSLRYMSVAQSLVEHHCDMEAVDSKTGHSSLYRALLRGDTPSSLFYIRQGANREVQDRQNGRWPIHVACLQSLTQVVEELLINGVNVNAIALLSGPAQTPTSPISSPVPNELAYNDGSTALHIAASLGDMALATLLCQQPLIRVDAQNAAGDSPLWMALTSRRRDMADLFFTSGAQIQTATNAAGLTWLHRASFEGNEFAAEFLLENKANPNAATSESQTPLHLAVLQNHTMMVALLLKYNADVNKRDSSGNAPLHIAMAHKLTDIVSMLLDVPGLELNAVDENGDSPLWLSLAGEQFSFAETLLAKGAHVDAPCGPANAAQSPLCRAITGKQERAAVFLLENGARIDTVSADGASALFLAIEHDMPQAARAAVARGASVDEPEGSQTPLDHALAVGARNCVGVLVENGANVNGKPSPGPEGRTLLEHRLEVGDTAAALYLILAGAEVNGDLPGRTPQRDAPLHFAARIGASDIMAELVQRKADVNRRNEAGDSPLHVAVQAQQPEAVKALVAADADVTQRNASGQTVYSLVYQLREASCGAVLAAHSDRFSTDAVDAFGSTLLMFAVKHDDYDGAAFLLDELSVDPKQTAGSKTFDTPLHVVAHKGHLETARRIIAVDPEACTLQNTRGRTPLHEAATAGHVDMVSLLLPHSMSPVLKDIEGATALLAAISAGQPDVAMMIASSGSGLFLGEVNLMGQSALHLLASFGAPLGKRCLPLFNLLVDSGVAIDDADYQGNTALLLAYLAVNEYVALELVPRGASLMTKNADGVSVLDVVTPQLEQETPGRSLLQRRILELIKEPPVWVDLPNCQICASKFTVNKRKHHCRHCGRIACSNCLPSSRKLPIEKFGEKSAVRLCGPCYDTLSTPSAKVAF